MIEHRLFSYAPFTNALCPLRNVAAAVLRLAGAAKSGRRELGHRLARTTSPRDAGAAAQGRENC